MICSDCDTYPCDCHRVIGSVMSEARALVCVILLMVTLVWAFWYASQRRDAANCRGFESSQGCVTREDGYR